MELSRTPRAWDTATIGPRLTLPVRQTIALTVLAIGLATTLALAGVVGENLRMRLERQTGLALVRHAALVAGALDRGFYDRWRDLQVAAAVDAAKLAEGSDRDQRAVIDHIVASQPDYAWVGYVDRDGAVRAASGDPRVGSDVRDRPWFAEGLRGMHASDVHDALLLADEKNSPRGEPPRLLDLSAPVRDRAGATVGVLAAHFPWRWAFHVEEGLRPSLQAELAGAEVLILSRNGAVLLGQADEAGRPVSGPVSIRAQDGVERASGRDGRSFLTGAFATRGYRDYPGLGWSVLVRQAEATALAPASELERDVLARGVPLSLLAAVLAYFLADILKRSLDRVRGAATALGRGEVIVRPSGLFSEFRQIGDALDAASTNLREREAALNAEKCRLAFALEGANDGIWDWDVVTGRVWYSPRWLHMLGYRPGELEQHFSSWERIVHPEDRPGVIAALNEHREGGTPYYQAEHRLWHKERRWVWVLTRGRIVERDPDGRPLRAVGTHTDITDRKDTEEALAASETRFRTLFERAPVGIADVTLGCRLSAVNDRFCRIVGYDREELIGKTFQEITHPEDIEADTGQVRALLGGRIPHYDMEKRYVRKDGQVVWAYLAVGLVRDDRGRPAYFLSSIKDITARKEAERALQVSETFTRSVVESSADCIKVLDLDGRLQFMNSIGLCAMEVDDFDRVRDHPWVEFWPEGNRPDIERAVASARNGSRERLVAFCPTLRGTPKWWDVCITPVLGCEGRPERLLAISREITSLKQAEERLHLLMGELNHRVKNLFATVQALMRLSARPGDDVNTYKERILARLNTLARTNEILLRGSWAGAGLHELLNAELDAFDLGERLISDGRHMTLLAAQAVPISMMLHELTTNAAKYGALSVEEGTLVVSWQVEEAGLVRLLKLTWTERGGPPVTPPARKGFGTRLIQDALARELDAEILIDYRPEGLVASLTVPLV